MSATWERNARAEFNAACSKYRAGCPAIRTNPNGIYAESLQRTIGDVTRRGQGRCLETVECAVCNARAVTVDNLELGVLTRCTFAPWAHISGPRAVEYDSGLWICRECAAQDEENRAVEYAERYADRSAAR